MLAKIETAVEKYDNTGAYLVFISHEDLKTRKQFIKRDEDIDKMVQKIITDITGGFSPEDAEATLGAWGTIEYHNSRQNVHYKVIIRIEIDGIKAELESYYLETA